MGITEAVDTLLSLPDAALDDKTKEAIRCVVVGAFGSLERIAVALEAIQESMCDE